LLEAISKPYFGENKPMAKKSTKSIKPKITKAVLPAELNKAIVLFVAAILTLLVPRFGIVGSTMSILLVVIAFALFLGSFYFVLKWSGIWDKLKKSISKISV